MTGIHRDVFSRYSANPGRRSTCLAYSSSASGPVISTARTGTVRSPSSTEGSGSASTLRTHFGSIGAPPMVPNTTNRAPSGRYTSGFSRGRPLLMPLAWRISSVAPSRYPPTLPPFARNSSMIPAFQSLGSDIRPSCHARPPEYGAGSGWPVLVGLRARQEVDAHRDRLGDVDDLAVQAPGLVTQHLERALLVGRVPLHQDALGPLGDRAAGERALEALVLGEPRQHDVERALQRRRVHAERDVGEDPSLGGLADEGLVLEVEDRDHRARGLGDDPSDEVERALRALSDDDDRGVGANGRARRRDLAEVRLPHDLVTELGHALADLVEAVPLPVRDEDPKAVGASFVHHGSLQLSSSRAYRSRCGACRAPGRAWCHCYSTRLRVPCGSRPQIPAVSRRRAARHR